MKQIGKARAKSPALGLIDLVDLPANAGTVFAEARKRALEHGQKVLLVSGDQLIVLSPGGERKVIKKLTRPKVKSGGIKKGVRTRVKWQSPA